MPKWIQHDTIFQKKRTQFQTSLKLEKEVEGLWSEMEFIYAFLNEADKRRETDEVIKIWVKQVWDVSYDIEGVLDKFVLRIKQFHGRGFIHSLQKTEMSSQSNKEAQLVSIDRPSEQLIGWLKKGESILRVISVVGMGGIGKTTLVKMIFNKVEEHFDCHAWITVSKSFTIEKIKKQMIE
uniref:Uncharacterized protein n=1 Tax=Nelumbo nucifera TaxID=4432 RepID=A0A822Z431_NELNU|nr:TPA_asm: hypothetical protein HUJ06_013890 [Nelumbo nucifera]